MIPSFHYQRVLSRIACVVALLFCVWGMQSAPAHAQTGLEIRALHADTEAPVSGVTVRITNNDIGFESERTTGPDGRLRLSGLSTSGRYDVRAPETNTYYEAGVTGIRLRADHTRSITLLMVPVAEYELDEVVVSGANNVASVNRVNAEVSSSLAPETIENTPVEGRNFTQVLKRLPNVTPATGFFSEAPVVSINGANGLYANYLIDGMDNNENFLGGPKFELPTGMIKDITVLSSTYSAEFGRTGNGIFNVTTKSGGNDYTGEAFYLTRPGPPLDASSPFAQRDLSGNAVKNGFSRQQGGFSIGGPIVRDQTFFFVNAEHTTDFKDNLLNVPSLNINETVDGRNHLSYLSARVDHRWSERWRSTLRANGQRVRIDRQGGGLTGGVRFASAADTQVRDGWHVALANTYTGNRWLYESNLQYSGFNWDFAQPENPDAPQVTMLAPDGSTTLGILGHPGFRFDETERTVQLQQKVRYNGVNHQLLAGVDVLRADFSLAGGGNPNGNYTVRLSDAQVQALRNQQPGPTLQPDALQSLPGSVEVLNYGVETRPATFGTDQVLIGTYLEDQVSPLSDLNVTAGLRWDYDSLSKGGADAGDFTNIAPRLSLNYSLGARTALRGGYGMFYDKIVYSIYSDALQFSSTAPGFRTQLQSLIDQGILPHDTNIDRVTNRGNLTANAPNPGAVPFLDGPTPDELANERASIFSNELRILNPNGYDNPLTHQFSVGVQREVNANTLFYVDLIHTRSLNQFRLRDLNAPDPFSIDPADVEAARANPNRDPSDLVRTQFEADQTRPTDIFERDAAGNIRTDANGNPQFKEGVARQIVMTETAGEARYWAANVNLVKERGQDDFAYRLSYTLSRLRNNTDDINFRAEDANDFADEWGPSVNDRTHVISSVLSYFPADRLRLTLASLLQSGQPINRVPSAEVFGTTDLNGDGRAFSNAYLGNSDRYPGESRNSDRLPWSTTFDVSVQYALPLADGRLIARADIFNVLNAENLSGFANNATQSNQIQTGPASSRRFVQRNAGPPRQFQFGLRYAF